MDRDLDHEYEFLKKQYYKDKVLTADQYLQGIRELAEAYDDELRKNGLMPHSLEVAPIA